MATQAQIDANRQNAQRSCGPTTPAGKARSSRNRLSYGFAGSVLFIDGEDREQFNLLLADLHHEFLPATASEQILLEKMAQNQWFALRACRLQGIALRSAAPGHMPNDLGLLIRYHQSSDRGFYKARAELLTTQETRKKSEIGFEWESAPQPPETTAEPPLEPPAPQQNPPEPPPETAPIPALSIPATPQWTDFDDLEDQLQALMNGPDGEMARKQIEELRELGVIPTR